MKIEIKVKGIGGLIDYEAELIYNLFKKEGFNVEIDNPCRLSILERETMDKFMERNKNNREIKKPNIKVIVQHIPWGG